MKIHPGWDTRTVRGLYERGTISLDDIPLERRKEVDGIEPCGHARTIPRTLVSYCEQCQRVVTMPVNLDLGREIEQLRQGLVALEDIEAGTVLEPWERDILTRVPRCLHPAASREICKCGGSERERCKDCGRRFADSSQWVLDHQGVGHGA